MKKNIIFLILLFLSAVAIAGNDIIYKKDKTEITCKLIEIDDVSKVVKYKTLDNIEGPTFTIPYSDISMVTLSTGNVWKPALADIHSSRELTKADSKSKKDNNKECFPNRCRGFEFRIETGTMLYIGKQGATPLWDVNCYWGGKTDGSMSLGFVGGMEYTFRDNILVPIGAGAKFYSNKRRASFLFDVDGGYKPWISISESEAVHMGYVKICVGAHIWLSRAVALTLRTGYCYTGELKYGISWHSMPFTVGVKF